MGLKKKYFKVLIFYQELGTLLGKKGKFDCVKRDVLLLRSTILFRGSRGDGNSHFFFLANRETLMRLGAYYPIFSGNVLIKVASVNHRRLDLCCPQSVSFCLSKWGAILLSFPQGKNQWGVGSFVQGQEQFIWVWQDFIKWETESGSCHVCMNQEMSPGNKLLFQP